MSTKKTKETITEAAMEAAALDTGAVLAKTPKVRIKIALDRKNPANQVVPVAINGYLYYIKRGESVEVPQTVADILAEAEYI